MKIKRKGAKPSKAKTPIYFLGYSSTFPPMEELTSWYNLEYGGPLQVKQEPGANGQTVAAHGPWTATLVFPLPQEETGRLRETFAWNHQHIGSITAPTATPASIQDTILFAARLARGLTLLTQGTTCEVISQTYLNPSDWQDRGLAYFILQDHVSVGQGEGSSTGASGESQETQEWIYTLGLTKFGLDELEGFLPKGLPSTDMEELLLETADEILRIGQSPKVGSEVRLPLLGKRVTVIKHRTAAPTGRMMGFREISLS